MKCMIIDDNMNGTWKEILESLSRQHIDEENNKKKRINKQALLMLNNATSDVLQTTEIVNEEARTAILSLESPQSI